MLRPAFGGVVLACAVLLSATPASPTPAATPKPPSAGVCKPATIRMEYFSSLGGKLGEYNAVFNRIEKVTTATFTHKCLWLVEGSTTSEAFVVFISYIPIGTPGTIASGDCARNRPDSPPFYNSRKRQLSVSGGERQSFQRALGGNEKVIKSVLAAAEAAGVGLPCPGTEPKPTPKPKPKPTPSPPTTGGLGIDYDMQPRYGISGTDGLVEYHDTAAEIRPTGFRVHFEVTRKDGKPCSGTLGLTVPKATSFGSDSAPCSFHATYREEGTNTVTVTLADGAKTLKGTRTFVVQDWLIVGLGDSNGSGEGAPDRRGRGGRWQDEQCHRSARSFEAQTARAIERRDKRTSVTFVHLACSGATIVQGILGAYEGIEPDKGRPLPPQVAEMKRLVGDREIDAVMISIGVNDLRFGTMVGFCIANDDCPNVRFPEPTSQLTLAAEMSRMLSRLPGRYKAMAAAVQAAGVAKGRVYLSEYFDSTRDDNKTFCNPLIYVPLKGTFDQAEARWAHTEVLVPLNAAVRGATTAHGWGYIGGAYEAFRAHGYCAKNRWIVQLTESYFDQGNREGTLHATERGNTEQAKGATATIRADMYAGGRTRPPKG